MDNSESATDSRRVAQNLALVALIVGATATALNPVFVRLSDLEPTASAFHRMAWALPVFWIWLGFDSHRAAPAAKPGDAGPKAGDRWLLALCGLFFAGDLVALHWSIQLTAVANAILFLNAQPIYVVFGAWLLFGERPTALFLAAIALAVVGAVVMVGESATFGGARLLGDALGCVAGLCYAGYILTASRLRARKSTLHINAWTVSVACPCLLAVALIGGNNLIPATLEGWGLMIALGVVSQAAGQGFIVWGMAHLSAAFSSVALLAAPVASALFAWAFLAEAVSNQQLLGMAVVLVGIYLANRVRALP